MKINVNDEDADEGFEAWFQLAPAPGSPGESETGVQEWNVKLSPNTGLKLEALTVGWECSDDEIRIAEIVKSFFMLKGFKLVDQR